MFDLVLNHISSSSVWFQKFLQDEPPYTEYFHVIDPGTDLSGVVRPRPTPVLTEFNTPSGLKKVWTTFSTDQIDLNYDNPRVLLEMIAVFLFYVARGARIIRLDAIAYVWKTPGTSCIHLPQDHAIVKLLRAILDACAPDVLLITETNVPHKENISYFGETIPELQRSDEAQMVYQFPLGPLTLHTFITGDASRLTDWAMSLPKLAPGTTFFNFTASHDGIGIRPAEGLLNSTEIQALVNRAESHAGLVSYGSNPEGARIPYELNISWYDALNDPANPHIDLDIDRFLASQAIMLSLAGVPGIYIHSLLGSRNCQSCLKKSGRARSINREKFRLAELQAELSNPEDRRARVLVGYRHLLQVRREQPAFNPGAAQQVLRLGPEIFAVLRTPKAGSPVVCLINVSPTDIETRIRTSDWNLPWDAGWVDLLNADRLPAAVEFHVRLSPFQVRWLCQPQPISTKI